MSDFSTVYSMSCLKTPLKCGKNSRRKTLSVSRRPDSATGQKQSLCEGGFRPQAVKRRVWHLHPPHAYSTLTHFIQHYWSLLWYSHRSLINNRSLKLSLSLQTVKRWFTVRETRHRLHQRPIVSQYANITMTSLLLVRFWKVMKVKGSFYFNLNFKKK